MAKQTTNLNVVKNKKKLFFNMALLFLICGLIIGIEGLLNLVGSGAPTVPFKSVQSYPGVLIDDPKGYKKYYPKTGDSSDLDAIRQNIFQMPKPTGVKRGIVLGESTAQGFPYLKNQSFGKLMEVGLKKSGSTLDVELLNVGRAAMSSYYVRDMAGKLMAYDPDFLVIYAGHNEYYGTISRSTGSFHGARLLYMALKEFKIFQGLFDLFAPSSKGGQGTRMAQQFADKVMPLDQDVDRTVASEYLDNLDSGLTPYLEKKIPVVLFEPVSNLGMPPFAGAKPGMEEKLKSWNGVIDSGDKTQSAALALNYQKQEFQNLATIIYLDAKTRFLTTGQWPEDRLTLAKDLDASPFRARSALVSALRDWAKAKQKQYPSLLYIQTGEELKKTYGQEAYSGRLFIDHLHFNFEGQRAIARLGLEALSTVYPDQVGYEKALSLLTDDKSSRDMVHLTDLFEYRAIHSVEKLLKFPPYSTMVLTPDFGLEKMKGGNTIYQNPELTAILEKAPEEDFFSRGMSYFKQAGIEVFQVQNLFAMSWVNPGAPESHFMMGEYFSTNPNTAGQAEEAFRKASLLSGKNPNFEKKIKN